MQRSGSTTSASSAVSQVTEPMPLEERPTMNYTESTRTKPSKISQITNPLKKASSKFDQKLQNLRSRVSKSKAVSEKREKSASIRISSPEAIEIPKDEGESAVDAEKTNKDEAKKARRDARRAKWAAMRESLKKFGRLAGKAAFFTGAVILGFIFGPILIASELIMSLVVIVIGLVLQLVEIIFTPCIICFDW
ncbi:hypothetical protein FJTKL_01279 [Diaporthe vaccinii]|uniref:Uncharacterized protein n=1 Tax=Diaporthe vaccinii TaxID=105482 RepID=A0ABR4E1D5_9PEZI